MYNQESSLGEIVSRSLREKSLICGNNKLAVNCVHSY